MTSPESAYCCFGKILRSHHAPRDEPSALQGVGKRSARHAERGGYVAAA